MGAQQRTRLHENVAAGRESFVADAGRRRKFQRVTLIAPRPAAYYRSAMLNSRIQQVVLVVVAVAAVYGLVAYVVMPMWWRVYVHRHPAIDEVPGITQTSDGIPGDPLNVALVGSHDDVVGLMLAAGWNPADKLSLESSLKIAADTVLSRPYADAPVSNLFLFGRKEDLAFEQPVGSDPRKRHHVRFWKAEKLDEQGRPLWMGAGTYDERVGLSHTTGQITHHVAADVDAERDHIFATLKPTGRLSETYFVDNFHKVREGKNGGGDPWRTDGRLEVGVIAPAPPK
jgi:hypothetical protein